MTTRLGRLRRPAFRHWGALIAIVLVQMSGWGLAAQDDIHIQGQFLEWYFSPDDGGVLGTLNISGTDTNLSGAAGLLQEGFGVGSHYLPNRRLNERLEIVDAQSNRPLLRYSYDCDGPNIKGLRVTRLMEPIPSEASLRVTWTIENTGDERQWIAPWVRNDMRDGTANRMDLPTFDGVIEVEREAYYPAARNWAAITDSQRLESVSAVFHSDHVHAFLALLREDGSARGFQAAFVPRLLRPGESWVTMYRLNVVRGLRHIDFASDELALQLDHAGNQLTALFAGSRTLENVNIDARVMAENGRVWRLPRQRFDLSPERMARCVWDWEAPGPGNYYFIARLSHGETPIQLGEDTSSPHGAIDTQFVVGTPSRRHFEAWTDAPHLLDRGPRSLSVQPAALGEAAVWFSSSMDKVFSDDAPVMTGNPDPVVRLHAARNEFESFQVCIRPAGDRGLTQLRATAGALSNSAGARTIAADDERVHQVLYHDIRIPSHYEGPTGMWPDALPPHRPLDVPPGTTAALWITVRVRADTPAGVYRGPLSLVSADGWTADLAIEIRVHDFALPETPALKTDFGFSAEAAIARAAGMNADAVLQRYLQNALEHRVTLRDLTQFPRESADYRQELNRFAARLPGLQRAGASTFMVPESLLDAPAQLSQANDFVVEKGLRNRVFTQLAYEPEEPAWPRVLERMQQWKNAAPDIPILVSTKGLKPFIPDALDIWSVHAQIYDTTNNVRILRRTSEGGEVWWYINHMPPRPYGNFFVDFSGIEHRILFWQAWALGIRGMQYWHVNFWRPDGDPFDCLLDITPANGDGILIYPGPEGPINSIRWEIIRDGIEDYDYLALFMERMRRLRSLGGHEPLLQRAAQVYNLEEVVPSLVTFTRDSGVLSRKRLDIAEMILEMDRVLR